MRAALGDVTRYPDGGLALRRKLAQRFGVKVENVIAGAGSEGIMADIVRTFLSDEDEVLTSEGTFMGMRVLAQGRGVAYRTVPMRDWHFDLEAIAAAINAETKLIYLANPNNPTGTIFSRRDFDAFHREVPERVLIILDEAYFEYAQDNPLYPDSLHYRYDNVITLRTFSKAYGLAGVRIGYGLAHEDLIAMMLKLKLPFEPSSLASAAGLAALDDREFLHRTLESNARGMRYLTAALQQMGLNPVPSEANFVMAPLASPERAKAMFEALLRQGVIVRPLGFVRNSGGLANHDRNHRGERTMRGSARTDLETRTGAGGEVADFLPLLGTDHVELYVGNAKQSAYYYRAAFGFSLIAYRGPETGTRDRASYVLEQGKVRLVLTTPLNPDSEIAQHVRRHGDGVKDIALTVDDAEAAFRETTARGARPHQTPASTADEFGTVKTASIAIYGETIHTFIERRDYRGAFLPGFAAAEPNDIVARPAGLEHIDHMVGNVGWGEMDTWAHFYADVMGFQVYKHFDDKDISTEYSALMSKVMANGNGRVKFPINEPAAGRRRSQIEEYLDFYGGPGVQHIAMATPDIIGTVTKLRAQGVEFLTVPATYYEELSRRVGSIDEPMDQLAKLGILVDRDEEGYMLQIFTKPVEDRPTLFFEIIQRKGSRSFGKGNFKALFEAIEREQARRGNL